MPELITDHHRDSLRSFQSPELSTLNYPTSFLQAGAVLAVHLATRTRAEQDHQDHQDYQGQDLDDHDEGGGIDILDHQVELVPRRLDYPAPSLTSLQPHPPPPPPPPTSPGSGSAPSTETLTDTDTDNFDHAHHSHHSRSPPRKRRRFETQHSNNNHHDISANTSTRDLTIMCQNTGQGNSRGPMPLNSTAITLASPKLPQSLTPVPDRPNQTRDPDLGSASQVSVPHKIPFTFFHFPGEIRNIIYDYSLHWPTCQQLYRPYNRRIDEYYRQNIKSSHQDRHVPFPEHRPRFRAPTILLLCRAITTECMPILQSRTLVINRLPPWRPGQLRPMPLTDFITKDTLQAVRQLEIRIPLGLGSLGSGWVWSDLACDLLNILNEKNKFEHLRVAIIIHYNPNSGVWELSEQLSLEEIDEALVKLELENPNIRTPCTLEREYWIVGNNRATRARTNSKGELHASEEEPYVYPDGDFWSGGVLEFT